MVSVQKVIDAIRQAAPETLQESWDNSGVQILTDPEQTVERILSCLEINDDIVEEAIARKADLIVTHHPLIFGKLSAVRADDVVGGQIIRLIRAGISVYSAHTSFDSARMGTNEDLARQLGLSRIRPMETAADDPEAGMGRIGEYDPPVPFSAFVEKVKTVCGGNSFRAAGTLPEQVGRVTLCTGAGAEFLEEACRNGSDVYLTGDVKYHDARRASDIGLCVIDAGHYGTEVLFGENMAAQLREILGSSAEVLVAGTDINPFIEL